MQAANDALPASPLHQMHEQKAGFIRLSWIKGSQRVWCIMHCSFLKPFHGRGSSCRADCCQGSTLILLVTQAKKCA